MNIMQLLIIVAIQLFPCNESVFIAHEKIKSHTCNLDKLHKLLKNRIQSKSGIDSFCIDTFFILHWLPLGCVTFTFIFLIIFIYLSKIRLEIIKSSRRNNLNASLIEE